MIRAFYDANPLLFWFCAYISLGVIAFAILTLGALIQPRDEL